MGKAVWAWLIMGGNLLIVSLHLNLHLIAICGTNFHRKTLAMFSKRYRLRNSWSQRTHGDCKSCNPVNEAVLMEIHDERILSDSRLYLVDMPRLRCGKRKRGSKAPVFRCNHYFMAYLLH